MSLEKDLISDKQKKYNVLFVSSGNIKGFDVAPFIKVQGDSLSKLNINVTYFRIIGKGFKGYISNIGRLRKILKKSNFDLIHAHFTFSAWVAVLSRPKIPIVLSLMGTDAYGRVEKLSQAKPSLNILTVSSLIIQPFVKKIISKSPNIEKVVWQKNKSNILPNGVNLDIFYPTEKSCMESLNLKPDKKYVLFLGNINDPRKNFQLLNKIKKSLRDHNIEILTPYPIEHSKIIAYLNSADLLVMCSLQEGSPNVVKEAMACNCKGVFTDVGDVASLIGNTKGYVLTDFDPVDLKNKILGLINTNECDGRSRLLELGLDLNSVALRLKNIYSSVLSK
nr:glycosyltransferase family 4 protein [Echinicola sp. 20G]